MATMADLVASASSPKGGDDNNDGAAAGAGGGDGGGGGKGKKSLRKMFKSNVNKVMQALHVISHLRRKTFKYADDEGEVNLKTKLLYAAPSFSLLSLTILISVHAVVFYEELGASLTFIAFFTAVGRSFDVITDPLMGWVSDSTRSRWGRRRPYIAVFCAGYAIAFFLFMTPPKGLSETGTAYWFGVWYIVFYLFDTLANVPYTAWGPELTDNTRERESVFFWRGLFGNLGVLAGAAGPAVLGGFIDSQRAVFSTLAFLFGAYYVGTMELLVFSLRERSKSLEPPPVPLVPSILRAFKNVAFRPLLYGWVLDFIALGMISSMIPFFVKFVIKPDDPDTALGIALGALFIAAGLAMPVWKKLSLIYGKRNVWLAYNLFNSISNFFFILLGEGDEVGLYLLAFINGIPVGGQFLIEAILSDVIDYDEFLNGTRSEGSFTVFATFIPKVVSIPSAAIPLAILSAVGFRGSVDGVDQEQSGTVKDTIRVIFVIIPSVATLASFFIKLKFPLKNDRITGQVSAGIVKHEADLPAYDPVIGVHGITVMRMSEEDQETAFLLDNFAWSTLLKFSHGTPKYLKFTVQVLLAMGIGFTVMFIVIIGLTFDLLEDDALAWIPSFCSILAGVSLCFSCVQVLRMRAAKQLENMDVPKDLVDRIILHKQRGQRGGDTKYDPADVIRAEDLGEDELLDNEGHNILELQERELSQQSNDANEDEKEEEEE